ncbi:HNH endonuclease [Leptospira interrogans]|uniref:HNH endonuclease domain protein n=4 Tax=Leptospira interrogans TaxID=173 RepID=A0A0F6H7F1_LEPIR|nr:HNH endonuclease [Leptospira interrogans]EKO24160.1 HNH endonuclease domain protein [Leptospira interrogans str. UI 12621]
MSNKTFFDFRLTPDPHYFATGTIGKITADENRKRSYFAEILDFIPFRRPVKFKNGAYLEEIPPNRIKNWWRDGVRKISKKIYEEILVLGEIVELNGTRDQVSIFETTFEEGKSKIVFGTRYERNAKLRQLAISFHGTICTCCGFDFKRFYGKIGDGFIHVHHIRPIAKAGKTSVNPRTDMVVLCANCHAMVHRSRQNILSVEELKEIIRSSYE